MVRKDKKILKNHKNHKHVMHDNNISPLYSSSTDFSSQYALSYIWRRAPPTGSYPSAPAPVLVLVWLSFVQASENKYIIIHPSISHTRIYMPKVDDWYHHKPHDHYVYAAPVILSMLVTRPSPHPYPSVRPWVPVLYTGTLIGTLQTTPSSITTTVVTSC